MRAFSILAQVEQRPCEIKHIKRPTRLLIKDLIKRAVLRRSQIVLIQMIAFFAGCCCRLKRVNFYPTLLPTNRDQQLMCPLRRLQKFVCSKVIRIKSYLTC